MYGNIPISDAQQEQKDRESECNCYQGHVEECDKWDGAQAFRNLRSDIECIEQLTKDGFTLTISQFFNCYVVNVKHPNQEEEFTGSSLTEIIQEIGDWVTHCNQGR